MDLISQIVERAKANKQRIVLPEGTEERTLKAANQILTDGVADLILLGRAVGKRLSSPQRQNLSLSTRFRPLPISRLF